MKKILTVLAVACLCACTGTGGEGGRDGRPAPETAADRRQAWRAALADSVDSLQRLHEECQKQAEAARMRLEALVERFEVADDPMLVEQYRVARGWRGYDTTGKQGLLARVLEDGSTEIVATCAGDFSHITLGCGGESVRSASVPPGSALHSHRGGLTRVAFNDADELTGFVSGHADGQVSLTFSNGKSFTLSEAQKRMMADTHELSTLLRQVNGLGRQESVIYNKLQLCRAKVRELEQQ